ncbi:MAG: type IV secretory system conjugative DNA transfer family protein [Nitrospira sp.]|nr:type IV secretory system conjugative DNA transfer family protein [Nitrospira sp.]MBS0194380.1 type IV secretory system conjugative DNA transfer family protein [Pseudomonadota bacterium]
MAVAGKPAPLPVRVALVAILALGAVPGWLFLSGHLLNLLMYKGAANAPAASMMTWLQYWKFYSGDQKTHGFLLLSALIAAAICLAPLGLMLLPRRRSLHGEARFASHAEVRRAGLLTNNGDGIIVGRRGSGYLTAGLGEYPHVLLAAPTGSGKGVGVVIPNLLNWNHSAIVLDIKHENWQLTAGFRKQHGHAVYLFDPASPTKKTHRWNPLAYVRADPSLRVDDLQKIANIIFPDIQGTDPIWTASCRSLFLGLGLYLLETPGKPATFGQMAREVFSGDDKRFKQIIKARAGGDNPLSGTCRNALEDYLNTSDNTRTSIRKTFSSRFELFLNPAIDAATAGNDFDLTAIRKSKMTIYLGITPDNLGRLAPLLSLFFQQVVDLNTRELPEHNLALKYQCLLLLDEFRSLGKMQVIAEAIAFLRGYNLRLLTIFQSPSQVREVYGNDAAETYFENHQVRIVYTPANVRVAREISEELGNQTVASWSKSRPTFGGKGGSNSESDQSRALLLPQEVAMLDRNSELVLAKGCLPIEASKIRWYEDPTFKHRVVPPPPVAPAVSAVVAPIEAFDDDKKINAGTREISHTQEASSYDFDFTGIELPKEDITVDEAEVLADRYYAAVTR